jgi:putative acyl-CoA dehydrogenase
MTRLDCVIGATGGMRWGVHQAVHHAEHRVVFGKRLIENPSCATYSPTWRSNPKRPPR